MDVFLYILNILLNILLLLIFLRILASWVPVLARYETRGWLAMTMGIIYTITDPIFRPLQRIIPPLRIGLMAIDFTPAILIFGIFFIQRAFL